jgi:threonine/homoserine/homoserine lactone efflux protein
VSIEFLVTTLIVVATPGTGVVYTLSAGLSRGARASVIAAVGCTLGIVPHMVAAITGLAALLHTSALAFQTTKYLGVVYLVYMAWRTLRERGRSPSRMPHRVRESGHPVRHPNQRPQPQAHDLLRRVPPAVRRPWRAGAVVGMLVLSGIFMLMTLVVFAAYGVFAAAVRTHVVSARG